MSDAQAPLCFGAVTFFSLDSDRCQLCAVYDRCNAKVKENIGELSRVIDLDGLLDRHRKLRTARQDAKEIPDTGKLKTQAPAIEKNVVMGTASVKADGTIELVAAEMRSIIHTLTGEVSKEDLIADLARGVNPYPQAMTERWVLCEILRRGDTTAQVIQKAVEQTGGSGMRRAVAVKALLSAKIVKSEGDRLTLNKE